MSDVKGVDPRGGGATYDFAKISLKNCMKWRSFWAVGRGGGFHRWCPN